LLQVCLLEVVWGNYAFSGKILLKVAKKTKTKKCTFKQPCRFNFHDLSDKVNYKNQAEPHDMGNKKVLTAYMTWMSSQVHSITMS